MSIHPITTQLPATSPRPLQLIHATPRTGSPSQHPLIRLQPSVASSAREASDLGQWRHLRAEGVRINAAVRFFFPTIEELFQRVEKHSNRIREAMLSPANDNQEFNDYFEAFRQMSLEIHGQRNSPNVDRLVTERLMLLREFCAMQSLNGSEPRVQTMEDLFSRLATLDSLVRVVRDKREESEFYDREALVKKRDHIAGELKNLTSGAWTGSRRWRSQLIAGAYWAFQIIESACVKNDVEVNDILGVIEMLRR